MTENDTRLIEMMSGLDPCFVSEAADRKKRPVLRRKISPMIAVAAATAALFVSAGSAYAVSVYAEKNRAAENKVKQEREASGYNRGLDSDDFVMHYIGEHDDAKGLADIYSKTKFTPIVTENEHLRLTVQTCLADDHYVRGVMTVEGLDDEGREYVRSRLLLTDEEFKENWEKTLDGSAEDNGSLYPWMFVMDSSGEKETLVSYGADGMFGTEDGKTSFEYSLCKDRLTEHAQSDTVPVTMFEDSTITKDHKGIDHLKSGIFGGMSFELPTGKNVGDLTLESGDGRKLYVSELCFYGSYDGNNGFDSFACPVTFSYQNGNKVIYSDSWNNVGAYDENGNFYQLKHADLDGGMNLFELEGLISIDCAGTIYYPVMQEK